MMEHNFIRKEFIGIHSTGVRGDDWKEIAKADMKVVWSPLSNLILYNQTTDIKGALDRGVPLKNIALAPDWAPSGSPNLLSELKIAHEYSVRRLDGLLGPKELLSMTTANPGAVVGYDDYIGSIKEGPRVDITIVKVRDADPDVPLVLADVEDGELVRVDGQPLYGELA